MKIPEPRKLNSGSWFIQLRLNGVSVPVTASTAKECKQQAALIKAEYQAGKRKVSKEDLTPGQMIENFIAKYERVLSPATIRTYDKARRLRFKNYMDKPYKDIKDWQAMINDELKIVSNKTVRTNWGAVTTALSDIGYSIPKVKFEPLKENDLSFLEPEEIPLFLKAAEGDSAEIEMLLELHSLRISEALYVVRHDMIDLKHNVINVRGAIVQDKDNKFVEKGTTKTSASARTIPIMIPRLADLLKEYQDSGKPIPIHAENTILSHVHKTCARAGVTDVTNHGLRRTFASLGYSLGLSELSMQQMGGWDDPGTMHKIYIKLAARDKKRAENAMTDFYRDKSSDARLADALSKLSDLLKEYADLSPLEPLRQQLSAIENANKNAN